MLRSPRRIAGRDGPKGRSRLGQALIEMVGVVVIFTFVGVAAFETAVLIHNLNSINNAMKQACWAASLGASDAVIEDIVYQAGTNVIETGFLQQNPGRLIVEVYYVDGNGEEDQISPQASWNGYATPQLVHGNTYRAAYMARSEGTNIRVGLVYSIGYFSPLFGQTPVFNISMPLSVSQRVSVRNDEDRDGLVDLYEPEFYVAVLGENWTGRSHCDNGISDPVNPDIDLDGIRNDAEDTSNIVCLYDYDNDGMEDRYEPIGDTFTPANMLRNPWCGGNAPALPY